MSSWLRQGFVSKTGFFAFQDIITSVTGVLILVTLILASHLEVSTETQPQEVPETQQRRLAELLAELSQLELESRHLRQTMTAVQAQPNAAQLQDDLTQLNARLTEEESRLQQLQQLTSQQRQSIQQRDQLLGLANLSKELEQIRSETKQRLEQDQKARSEKEQLEQELKKVESALLKAKSRQGHIWLIPDTQQTTKEPILVLVDRQGASVEHFDKPERRQVLSAPSSAKELTRILASLNPNNCYLVFYVRPSGVDLFNRLSETAKTAHFEVGFDALEESAQIHFSHPPPLEETLSPATLTNQPSSAASPTTNAPAVETPASPPIIEASPALPKHPSQPLPSEKQPSWWRRLLRKLGFI